MSRHLEEQVNALGRSNGYWNRVQPLRAIEIMAIEGDHLKGGAKQRHQVRNAGIGVGCLNDAQAHPLSGSGCFIERLQGVIDGEEGLIVWRVPFMQGHSILDVSRDGWR